MKKVILLLLLALLPLALPTQAESAVTQEEITLDGSLGTLYGVLQLPAGDGPWPLVILSHGFGGSRLGNQDYAEALTAQGFAAFNFDFCGGGYGSRSEGTTLEMSVLTEAQDLNAVLDHFAGDPRFSALCLWGESQGGFVSAYVAGQRPQEIAAQVLLYPAFVIPDDARGYQREDGSFPETLRIMGVPISARYGADALSFDIYEAISPYAGPVLILHGDRDAIVPLRYSEQALTVYANARLVLMKGQNHGFVGSARTEAKQEIAAFLQSALTDGAE